MKKIILIFVIAQFSVFAGQDCKELLDSLQVYSEHVGIIRNTIRDKRTKVSEAQYLRHAILPGLIITRDEIRAELEQNCIY